MASAARCVALVGAVAALAAGQAAVARAGTDLIFQPLRGNSGAEACVIFIEGAQIKPEAYVPFAQALQQAVPFPLWVAIPEFWLDVPEPLVLGRGIKRVTANMTASGMTAGPKQTFLGGHSLGGAMLIDYTNGAGKDVGGQFLFGAFLTRKYRNVSYPVPTLTVGGELDGLARVSRFTEEYYHRALHPKFNEDPVTEFPVAVFPGQNHMQFASGTPPALVKALDLHAEVTDEQARANIVALTSAWISFRMGDASKKAALSAAVASTGSLLKPLLSAMALEGSFYFMPSCDLNPITPACQTGAGTWTEKAQALMGKLSTEPTVTNTFHVVSEIFPTVHLPHIWNNCTSGSDQCVLNVTTVSNNIYASDLLDTGTTSNTATEIRAKLMSRQAMQTAAGTPPVSFNASDGGSLCATINEAAYEWAKSNAAPRTASRFAKFGEPYVMGPDHDGGAIGPIWIWTKMSYKHEEVSGVFQTEVIAPTMRTPLNESVKAAAGFHYCKLLSPAHAMEWMMVDGLRNRYSAHNFTSTA